MTSSFYPHCIRLKNSIFLRSRQESASQGGEDREASSYSQKIWGFERLSPWKIVKNGDFTSLTGFNHQQFWPNMLCFYMFLSSRIGIFQEIQTSSIEIKDD